MTYEVTSGYAQKVRLLGPFVVLDTAINALHKHTKKNPHETFTVVMVDDGKRTVRAFGFAGRVEWAVQCEDCKGVGKIGTYSPTACTICMGMGACSENAF